MSEWMVIRKFRKSGSTIYEVSNGEVVKLIFGYKQLMEFMGKGLLNDTR